MKKNKLAESISTMVHTSDEWYCNYPNNKVKVTFIRKVSDGNAYISVWGNDDIGMDIRLKDRGKARKLFKKLIIKDNIIIANLKKLGFTNC